MSHHLVTSLEIGAVLSAHALAIIVNLSNVSDWLKLLSLVLAIGYTAWKWITDYRKEQKLKPKTKKK
jgi:hypothetical protein